MHEINVSPIKVKQHLGFNVTRFIQGIFFFIKVLGCAFTYFHVEVACKTTIVHVRQNLILYSEIVLFRPLY